MTPAAAARQALAIDASEWFLDPAWRTHVSPRHWRRLSRRAGIVVRELAKACEQCSVCATWFVSGELAAAEPALLRQLVAAGHELALAGVAAAPLDEVLPADREGLVASWRRERAAIEQVSGVTVRGFRAAWPVRAGEGWWRSHLLAAGLTYDATAAGGVTMARGFAGDAVPAPAIAAWRFDPGQPRLAGLPKNVFAAHYDQLRPAGAFAPEVPRAAGTIAGALGLPAAGPPPARAPEPVEARPATHPGVPRLAIVVPLKDEEAGVPSLLVELDNVARALADVAACEFVFVDDGSTDRTWSLLQQGAAARAGVRLVQHAQNRGVAAAIRTGIAATDAALVASIDGDLSYDPMELRAMLPLAAEAELVIASPYHPRGGVRNVPGWRLMLSRTLSAAYRRLLGKPVFTWTSCFRVYRRAAVADLPLDNPGFLGVAELLVRVLRAGGRVVEHPCVLEARLLGFSKMRVLRTIRGHLGLLWRVMWRRLD